MNIVKVALRRIQAILPKSWQRPSPMLLDAAVDRFEISPRPKTRSRVPAVDWAAVDRSLPLGDPLQIMDQVLGASPWYAKVMVPSIYRMDSHTTASMSQTSLTPPAVPTLQDT